MDEKDLVDALHDRTIKRTLSVGRISEIRRTYRTNKVAGPNEIWSWCMYEFSTGPFWGTGINFLILLVTAHAKELAIENNGYHLETSLGEECLLENSECFRKPNDNDVWLGINYEAFAQICMFVSVAMQFFVYLLISALADYSTYRHRMLIICNTLGALGTISIAFETEPSLYWYGGVVLILTNVMYGAANVFYNSYLPILVNAHHELMDFVERRENDIEVERAIDATTHQLSAQGSGYGMMGMITNLIFACIILMTNQSSQNANNTHTGARWVIVLTGIWSLGFSIVTFYYLQVRPGKPLPPNRNACLFTMSKVCETLRSRAQLPNTFLFLLSYFVYSDGISTLAQAAGVFALTELGMNMSQILLGLIVASFGGIVGLILFLFFNKVFGMEPKNIIIFTLAMFCTVPVYALLALHHSWEFYMLSAVFGLMAGPSIAFTRSLFSELIPLGQESAFFSLYQLTDKSSAWMGPLILLLVEEATGSFRQAFFSVAFFFLVGIIILTFVDVERGIKDADSYVDRNTGGATGHHSLIGGDNDDIENYDDVLSLDGDENVLPGHYEMSDDTSTGQLSPVELDGMSFSRIGQQPISNVL